MTVGNNMKKETNSYHLAKAQVKRIKGFYNHLFIYIVFLVLWILFSGRFFGLIRDSIGTTDVGFNRWADINFWLNPLIWGVIVLIHGLFVFGFKSTFFKKWEDRKLQEFIDEESSKSNN